MNTTGAFSIGQLATLACLLEVSIPKPGNVHRGADFADTTLQDFLTSAVAIGPAMEQARTRPLGETVLAAIQASRSAVETNTNLGIILLLAPLAAVESVSRKSLAERIRDTNASDSELIYQAIAACQPGGLGQVERYDVGAPESPAHILQAMELAAEGDLVARQYVNGFEQVLEFVLPSIADRLTAGMDLTGAVIDTHLKTMNRFPDSLIARKNGPALARESADRAGFVLDCGGCADPAGLKALEDLDFWLRADGNRRNPGTTADLITAGLFAGLRRGTIQA